MAKNPKKVKDPTEVALSAIQEALNISDAPIDSSRDSIRSDVTPANSSSSQDYNPSAFDTRPSADRQTFESVHDVGPTPRARTVYTLASLFAAVGVLGAGLLTVAFLPSLQAAVGQGSGALVLAGLAAMFFAPVLLFYFLASLSWRGQEVRVIAPS